MNVEDVILKRRSVRSYQSKDISDEKLDKVLEAARMAPSARNKQDWKFIVVRDEKSKEKVYEATSGQSQVKQAPVVIAGVSTDPDYMMSCDVPGGIVDVTIAMDHITLQAAELGLGTCWIGAFDQKKAKEALNVPEEQKIVALMPLGYPVEKLEKRAKPRKEKEEIVSYHTHE